MKSWKTLAALMVTFCAPLTTLANPSVPLNLAENSTLQTYSTAKTNACLVLDAGRPLGERDASALKALVMNLDVQAGPGLQPELQPAGALLYTYNLVPELKGTRLIYRGLLSANRGNAVKVAARGPASLGETVERSLGFTQGVQFIITHQCD